MDQTPPFRVELLERPFDHLAVVELEGEVDIHSASQFKRAVAQALDEGTRRIIIDLAKVSFIDSTALGVVVGGLKGVKAHGGSLDVVCPDECIRGASRPPDWIRSSASTARAPRRWPPTVGREP